MIAGNGSETRVRKRNSARAGRIPVESCAICGCTEQHACEGGCYWVDDPASLGRSICSRCVEAATSAGDVDDVAVQESKAQQVVTIPLGQLHRHPLNRQIDAKDPEIVNLAISMSEHGQLEPLRVRELQAKGGVPQYQIISGERRYTALISMGTFAARCIVVSADDATALAEVAVANSHRKDLNPIERAELMELLMKPVSEGGAGKTREQAGHVFGLTSDSGSKNALRLLQLPNAIKQLIVSGDIPERAARALVPYTAAPPVVNAIAKGLSGRDRVELVTQLSAGERPWLIKRAMDELTRPISPDVKIYYTWPIQEQPCLFDHTAHADKLQIVELPYVVSHDYKSARDKTEPRLFALNVKLWDKLQAPAIDALKKGKAAKSKKGTDSKQSKPAAKLTPAQQAADDKRRAAEAEKRLNQFTIDWKHRLLRCHVSQMREDSFVTLTLPWLTSCSYAGAGASLRSYADAALMECGIGQPARKYGDFDQLELLAGKPAAARGKIASDLAYAYWRVMLWPVSTLMDSARSTLLPAGSLPDRMLQIDRPSVEKLCALTNVSVETAWQAGATDASDERRLIAVWLARHTTAQLQALAKQLGVKATAAKRDGLVEELLAAHKPGKPLPLPKRLK